MKGRKKKIKLEFIGDVEKNDILIGSHGNTDIRVNGNFELSGIVLCPKYDVSLIIKGNGRISFRGKCQRIIIASMQGDCTLDLTGVTYNELHCQSLRGKAIVVAGNTRAITPAILSEEAILHVREGQLVFNPMTTGNAKIVTTTSAGVEEVLNMSTMNLM